eukprot:gene11585-11729_t
MESLRNCLLIAVRFSLIVYVAGAIDDCEAHQHPDLPGLLALRASICGVNCTTLASWNSATGDVCESFEGVYCAVFAGQWRVVSIHLQLERADVLLNDSQMAVAGVLQSIPYLQELELLCYHQSPAHKSGGNTTGKKILYARVQQS